MKKKKIDNGAQGSEIEKSSSKSTKKRIDVLLVEKGLVSTRQRAQALIMARKVMSGGILIVKAGTSVPSDADITVKEDMPFVGRGGLKLQGALDDFEIDVTGLIMMDVGSSTGGFTDCLLQRGAKKVHAIDVGRGLIDYKLRTDDRVHLLEGRNIRYLKQEEVGEPVDMAVIDVSFISLKKVLPVLKVFLDQGDSGLDSGSGSIRGRVVALVKPQFEVGKGQVGKGGIVKDPAKHRAVMEDLEAFSEDAGYEVLGVTDSPIKGAKGNKEFWLYLSLAISR